MPSPEGGPRFRQLEVTVVGLDPAGLDSDRNDRVLMAGKVLPQR
jgi:hypothetical protein